MASSVVPIGRRTAGSLTFMVSLRRALRGFRPQRQVELVLNLAPLVAHQSLAQPFELQVDDWCRVERQQLAQEQPADDGDAQRVAQFGSGAAFNGERDCT